MAVSFILPFITGVADAMGTTSTGGFGTIALIAAMPILTLQILGAVFTYATKKSRKTKRKTAKLHIEIIEFE